MSKKLPSDNQPIFRSEKKQVRNRYTGSAGITEREANTIKGAADKLYKISQKNNLYVVYERKLLQAAQLLYELLEQADRA